MRTRHSTAVAVALALLVAVPAASGPVSAAAATDLTVSTDGAVPIAPGETRTVTVTVQSADGGVGAAELGVAVADPSVARIVDVTVLGAGSTDVERADDGSFADVEYAFRDTADTGPVPIVEVTVEGVAAGETRVELRPSTGNDNVLVFDEGGAGYDVTGTEGAIVTVRDASSEPALSVTGIDPVDQTTVGGTTVRVSATVVNDGPEAATEAVTLAVDGTVTDRRTVTLAAGTSRTVNFTVDTDGRTPGAYAIAVGIEGTANATGTLTVRPPPVSETGAPPTDPDGDGLFEDVDGNDQATILDVVAFLAAFDEPTVTQNPAAFDFTGDGRISILDVVALLARF
jgi:PKD repeat protein